MELFRSGLEVVVFRPSSSWARATPSSPTSCARSSREWWTARGRRLPPAAHRRARRRGARPRRPRAKAPPPMHGGGSAAARLRPRGPRGGVVPALLERLAAVARAHGRGGEFRVREVSLADADAQARAGGWHGMSPDVFDCLLCDEISDPAPSRHCWAASSSRSTRRSPRRCGRLEPFARAAHGRAAGGCRRRGWRPGRAGRGPRARRARAGAWPSSRRCRSGRALPERTSATLSRVRSCPTRTRSIASARTRRGCSGS